MRKKTLVRFTALATIVAVLALAAPGSFAARTTDAAKPGPKKFNYTYVFKTPVSLLSTLFPFIHVFDKTDYTITTGKNAVRDGRKIRITGELVAHRLGDGD